MDLLVILLTCYLVLLSLGCIVEGRDHVAANEDLEIERQLKMLNKSPMKTIKTKEGEIIDCIDIYKQPALDHPLLKNHKIQMQPTELPKQSIGKTKSAPRDSNVLSMSSNLNCPQGTVPIRRTQREDLLRAKAFSESFSSNVHPLTNITPGKHQAIVRNVGTSYVFKGIEGTITVYNPAVGANQTSTAQLWIERGPRNTRNSLQAGWMVAPDLYGDNKTRWFSYWSVQGNTPNGCFNLLCKGFVQTSEKEFPGRVLPISDDGYQQHITFLIFQDRATGNWWLRETAIDVYGVNIGYWPKSLLPELSDGASTVVWGGQTQGRRNGASPGMGNGLVLSGDFNRACNINDMSVVDGRNALLPPAGPHYHTETFVDNTDCYKLDKYGYNGDDWRYSFIFGGPGGSNCGA